MRFEDLKDGMVIETRNEKRFLVLGDRLLGGSTWYAKCDLNDDLTDSTNSSYDVIKVYRSISAGGLDSVLSLSNLEFIWARVEEKFEYFELVEVRDNDEEEWIIAHFIEINENEEDYKYKVTTASREIFEILNDSGQSSRHASWRYIRKYQKESK